MKLNYLKSSKLIHYFIGIFCFTFVTFAAQATEAEKVGFYGTVDKLPPLKLTLDGEGVRWCLLDPACDPPPPSIILEKEHPVDIDTNRYGPGMWKDFKTSKLYSSFSADMDSINPKQNYWQLKNFQLVRGLY